MNQMRPGILATVRNEWPQTVLLSLLLVAYFWLGTFHLGKFMSVDEPKWLRTRIPQYFTAIQEQNWEDTFVDTKPGILPMLLAGITHIFLNPKDYDYQNIEHFLFYWRLPILIFNGLMLVLMYVWMRKLYGSMRAVFVTGLICLTPQLTGISQIVNPDSTTWSTMFLAFLSFLFFLRSGSMKSLWATGLFFGLALISKFSSTILYPAFFCILYMEYLFKHQEAEIFAARLKGLGYICLISMLVYFVLVPACWTDPALVIKQTIYSLRIRPVVIPFTIIASLLILEVILLKGRFTRNFRSSLELERLTLIGLSGYMLLGLMLIAVNEISGNLLFDYEPYKIYSPHAMGSFLPTLLINHYVSFLILSSPVLLGLIAFLVSSVFTSSRAKLQSHFFPYFLFVIVTFYLGASFTGHYMTPRYHIVLLPFFCLLCAPIVTLFSRSKWPAIAIFLVVAFLEIWWIRPFYLVYTNPLNARKYSLQGSWGIGGYEAAQYANSLPNSESLKIWTIELGSQTFFKGKTTKKTHDFFDSPPDYFLFRGMLELEVNRHSVVDKLHPNLAEKLRIPSDPIVFDILSKYNKKDPVYSLDVGYNRWNLVKTNVDDFVARSGDFKYNTGHQINLSKPFTISFWILPNNSSPGTPLDFRSEQENQIQINYGIPSTFGEIRLQLGNSSLSTGMISADHWHHITFCHNPKSGSALLLDGILKDSTMLENPVNLDHLIWLRDFDGVLDDFRVYDSALSIAQVEWLAREPLDSFNLGLEGDEHLPEPVCHLRFGNPIDTYLKVD